MATAVKTALTRYTVETAIAAAGGNVTEAARRLGISRGKLLRFRNKP
jgi:DNA-binding NtrC family response regulator